MAPRHSRFREGGTAVERHFARNAWESIKSQDCAEVRYYDRGTIHVEAESFPSAVWKAAEEHGFDYRHLISYDSSDKSCFVFEL